MRHVKVNGERVDYDATVNLMDDDLREELHSMCAPCNYQTFVDTYCVAHREKYGTDFIVN